MRARTWIAALVAAAVLVPAAPAADGVVNGSFETGSLSGWSATVPIGGWALVSPGVHPAAARSSPT